MVPRELFEKHLRKGPRQGSHPGAARHLSRYPSLGRLEGDDIPDLQAGLQDVLLAFAGNDWATVGGRPACTPRAIRTVAS